jgi:hypothetical protein
MTLTWETQVLGGKPVSVSLSPPEASNGRRKIEAVFPQWAAGDRYSVVAHLMVLRWIYLEKFRKGMKRLQLNQVRNRLVLGTSQTLRILVCPLLLLTRGRGRLDCSWVSSYRITGLDILNISTKSPCQNVRWSVGDSKPVLPERESAGPAIYARHWTVDFLGLCQ